MSTPLATIERRAGGAVWVIQWPAGGSDEHISFATAQAAVAAAHDEGDGSINPIYRVSSSPIYETNDIGRRLVAGYVVHARGE